MKVTYEEYMNLIPSETKEYVNVVFKYLKLYLLNNYDIFRKGYPRSISTFYTDFNTSSIYKAKLLLSSIMGLSLDSKFSSEICRYGFEREKVVINLKISPVSEDEKKKIFDSCNDLFCFHDDYTKYSSLFPIDIVHNALNISPSYGKNSLFSFFDIDKKFFSSIEQVCKDYHTKVDIEKESILYEGLPYPTIKYIETASKIRSILIKELSENRIKERDFLKNDDSYLVPISLLFSIFAYEKTNSIKNYFVSHNIDTTPQSTSILASSVTTSRNMESIELLYQRYWTEGVNKDKGRSNIQVLDILKNLFNRDFTKSVAIETMLNYYGKTLDDFSNISEKVAEFEKTYLNSKVRIEIKDFYSKINKDTKEFIIFACKTYQLLNKKIKLDSHNKDILATDDDLVTFAVYIASHFYHTDIDIFYNLYGVTFEKVIKLLMINITKEEIDLEELDKTILLDKFKRYVISVSNENQDTENISVNDVSKKLCYRNFNKTMFMENIFEEIRRDINLPENFLELLESTLKKI